MSASPSLAELQRWMRWALTHPLGAQRAIDGESLAGLPDRFLQPQPPALDTVAGDQTDGRTVLARLSVHGSGYFGRLRGTLELEYPRLAGALGEDSFRALVAAHLLRSPSRNPSLADLGEGLAETLRAQPGTVHAPWLVDLAVLERAAAEVWLSDPGEVGRWDEVERSWDQVRLGVSSAMRLVPAEWDVADWTRDAPPGPRSGWLVVWRVEASTGIEWIAPVQGQLLEALALGTPLGEACALAGRLGMTVEAVTAAFTHWCARGWLAGRNPVGLREAA
jgi:hypothetical protein